jgi:hypothetical protein
MFGIVIRFVDAKEVVAPRSPIAVHHHRNKK